MHYFDFAKFVNSIYAIFAAEPRLSYHGGLAAYYDAIRTEQTIGQMCRGLIQDRIDTGIEHREGHQLLAPGITFDFGSPSADLWREWNHFVDLDDRTDDGADDHTPEGALSCHLD